MNELKSKYKVDTSDTGKLKRTFNGILFDSEMEMKYYRDVLCPKMESGEVADVELQKVYQLQPKYVYHGKTIREITYVADFYVTYRDGTFEVIEIKGMTTPLANMKRKMFQYLYQDLPYRWLTYIKKYGGWVDFDYAKKCRNKDKKGNS